MTYNLKDYKALIETLSILTDPKAMKGIRKGQKDIQKGYTKSWEEIKAKFEK